MTPTFVDMSYFRDNLASIVSQVYQGKIFIVKKSDVPVMEVKKVARVSKEPDSWTEARKLWKKFVTDEESERMIKEIYKLRKDGSSRKKYLWKA